MYLVFIRYWPVPLHWLTTFSIRAQYWFHYFRSKCKLMFWIICSINAVCGKSKWWKKVVQIIHVYIFGMGLLMQTTDMRLEQRVKSKQRRPVCSNIDSDYQYHKVYKVKLFLADFLLDFMSCVFNSGKMLIAIVYRCQVQTHFKSRKCKGKNWKKT